MAFPDIEDAILTGDSTENRRIAGGSLGRAGRAYFSGGARVAG